MSVINKLASSLDVRNAVPNQLLAKEIIKNNDKKAIKELVENLSNKNKNIQSDCIKTLYEIGEQKSELISEHYKEFIQLLSNKNNRLVWGAMTAVDTITLHHPKEIYSTLPVLIDIADKGSVITTDHLVNILIKLGSIKQYSENIFPLLIEQLKKAPTNQLPAYAEKSIPIINEKNKNIFIKTISSRLNEIEKESKRNRVEKVIKKLTKN
ncbi:MAG: hypothetical protein ACXVPU_04085 [Bacteroidia bacterium]